MAINFPLVFLQEVNVGVNRSYSTRPSNVSSHFHSLLRSPIYGLALDSLEKVLIGAIAIVPMLFSNDCR